VERWKERDEGSDGCAEEQERSHSRAHKGPRAGHRCMIISAARSNIFHSLPLYSESFLHSRLAPNFRATFSFNSTLAPETLGNSLIHSYGLQASMIPRD